MVIKIFATQMLVIMLTIIAGISTTSNIKINNLVSKVMAVQCTLLIIELLIVIWSS